MHIDVESSPVERFKEFFQGYQDENGKFIYVEQIQKMSLETLFSLYVNYDDLVRYDPELARLLQVEPEETLRAADEALVEVLKIEDPIFASSGETFHVRFYNIPDQIDLRRLRAIHLGKLIAVEGIIIRQSVVKPLLVQGVFQCVSCGEIHYVPQEGGIYTEPQRCSNPSCGKKGPFTLLTEESTYTDLQTIVIQERPESLPPGQIPRSLPARLVGDLVDTVRAGDRAIASGILRMRSSIDRRKKKLATFDPWLDVNYISSKEKEFEEIEIDPETEQQILELSKNINIHQMIKDSIAPSVYGMDDIKEAIACVLFGGVSRVAPDGMRQRGESNILIVGDPGVAKCVAPGTEVLLSNGTIRKIEEIVEEHLNHPFRVDDGYYAEASIPIFSLDKDGSKITKKANIVWKRTAPEFMLKIQTRTGKEITVTPTHPFFILDEAVVKSKPAKELNVGDYVATVNDHSSDSSNTFLPGLSSFFRKLRVEYNFDPHSLGLKQDVYEKYECGELLPSLDLVKQLVQCLKEDYPHLDNEIKRLEQLITADIFWDEITKIEKIKPSFDWVYDLQVPETHNFVANGFYVHNSQLLQFTYRLAPRGLYTSGKASTAAGLCVSGDSLVLTSSGLVPIKKLVEEEFNGSAPLKYSDKMEYTPIKNGKIKVFASNNLKLSKLRVSKVWRIKSPSTLLKITTKAGKSLTLTPETSLLALNEEHGLLWIPAKNLIVGDCIATVDPKATEEGHSNCNDTVKNIISSILEEIILFYYPQGEREELLASLSSLTNSSNFKEKLQELLSKLDLDWHRHVVLLSSDQKSIMYNEFYNNANIQTVLKDEWGEQAFQDFLSDIEERSYIPSQIIYRIFNDQKIDVSPLFLETIAEILNEVGRAHDHYLKNYDLLKAFCSSDLCWDIIANVETVEAKEKYVYDLSVSGAHNFIVNGIVTHNTAAVVRDPDTGEFTLEAGALVLADRGICCLSGDSRVLLNNQYLKIEDVFNQYRPYEAISNNERIKVCDIEQYTATVNLHNLKSKCCKATKIRQKYHKGKLLELTFSSGVKLKLTPEHKLIDGNTLEWKEAREFKEGDLVLAPLKIPSHNNNLYLLDILPEDWLILLTQKQVEDLKKLVLCTYPSLDVFNRKYELKAINPTNPIQVGIFKQILRDLRCYDSWKQKLFKFGKHAPLEELTTPTITPELAYLVGLLYVNSLQEQSIKSHLGILTSENSVFGKKIKDVCNNLSPASPLFKEVKFETVNDKGNLIKGIELIVTSEILSYVFYFLTHNYLQNLLLLPDESLKAFLAGCLDGNTIFTPQKTNDPKTKINESMKILLPSKTNDVETILLALKRFDIYGKITSFRSSLAIEIANKIDVERFVNSVGNYSLTLHAVTALISTNFSQDLLPITILHELSKEIQEEVPRSILNERGVWQLLSALHKNNFQLSREQFMEVFLKLSDLLSSSLSMKIKMLLNRDYILEKIGEIQELNYEGFVYDLYVPVEHSFLCNGIIVHNCIDEFDKMNPIDRSSIHEAMEQHTVSIAKAGIVAQLNARTAIVAAANPRFGRYEENRSAAENINLPPTILSRFDLIFIVRDRPSPDADREMARHILELRRGHVVERAEPPIPMDLLRKYISYARQHVHPTLTDEAMERIEEYYLQLRQQSSKNDDSGIAITPRYLEALVRLSEAQARMALKDEVTVDHVEAAIALFDKFLRNVAINPETGRVDINYMLQGITKSTRTATITILEIIKRELEKGSTEMVRINKIIESAQKEGIPKEQAERIIEELKRTGELYTPRDGYVGLA